MDPNNQTPSPEELKAEQEALAEAKAEEIRVKIVTDYGFDEVTDAERIDKLVNREIEQHKKLSAAIGQKIKFRTERDEAKKAPPANPNPPAPKFDAADVERIAEKKAKDLLERRDLDGMSYPDDIKKEIRRVAEIQGVSVIAAERDPYIVSKIEAHKKVQAADEAAISRKNRAAGTKEFTATPPDVNMATEEGRKTWEEWKVWASNQGM